MFTAVGYSVRDFAENGSGITSRTTGREVLGPRRCEGDLLEIPIREGDMARGQGLKSFVKQEMSGSRAFACPCGQDAIS